ncbi:MAG TPA: type I secretion system permease/ATPase [Hellea balneolensis]|uniref:Type I secretion system permease/ATPase n=1 Tax=Hellea balneolensis TaxID=287478 RepID=A0A7C5QWL9_9PROT|nr:type I secretion system permease/ATPase [Hellea balneolensis]
MAKKKNPFQPEKTPVLKTEVGQALASSRKAFFGVFVFSAFINILMLTGPLYMLQVYDRVLASSSMPTLIAISILMAAMYIFMGFLEHIRSRVLVRIGDKLERDLGARTFAIWLKQGLYGKAGQRNRPLNDLATLRQFLSGPAPGTFADIPWVPVYIAVLFLFHSWLGWAGVAATVIIFVLALINERSTREPLQQANILKAKSQMFAQANHDNADAITAMGMAGNMEAKWQKYVDAASKETMVGSDRAGTATATTKAFRMFVQSSMLGLGGALAIQQIITPGMMIAGSIVLGRALAPVQMVLGQWRGFVASRQAFKRLNKFYEVISEDDEVLSLPEPTGKLSVENVVAAPPGSQIAVLLGVNFALEPGQGLAVMGPSASGKSTLARLLVGVWMPNKGAVRLDGATFAQWNREELGPHIGYLPQEITLFDGSIADNISRFTPDANPEDIVLAAKRADVHDMILRFADGYDTMLGEGGMVLSGGQTQRIALARALFGDPSLLVLDEPNANLDTEGDIALSKAIIETRKRGNTVVVMTHRSSAIAAVDQLLILREGKQIAFGPKDKVLDEMRKASPNASVQKGSAKPGPAQASSPPALTMNPNTGPAKPAETTKKPNIRPQGMQSFGSHMTPKKGGSS